MTQRGEQLGDNSVWKALVNKKHAGDKCRVRKGPELASLLAQGKILDFIESEMVMWTLYYR